MTSRLTISFRSDNRAARRGRLFTITRKCCGQRTWDRDGQEGQQYKMNLGTTSTVAILSSADTCWLSFAKDDDRIQAGRFEWFWDSAWNLWTPGERYTKRIQFQKPFKKIPKVTTAITHLDSNLNKNIRAIVSASNIDTQGFSLQLESFGGKCRLLLKALPGIELIRSLYRIR